MAFDTELQTETKPDELTPERPAPEAVSSGRLALILLAVAIALFQAIEGLGPNTSWLLTIGDRWLDGALPYRDTLDTNPPIALLVFLPSVYLSRLAGLAAELVLITVVSALCLAVIEWTVSTLSRSGGLTHPGRMRVTLGFALLVLPMSGFADPLHLAIIAAVPFWAVMWLNAEKRPVSRFTLVVGGICGGFLISINWLFLPAIILPALVLARIERRFSGLFRPEFVITGCFVLAYVAVLFFAFPAYFSIIQPLLNDLYRPVREPIEVILTTQAIRWTVLAVFGLWLLARTEPARPRIAMALLTSLGFVFAVVDQAKSAPMQFYPMVASLVPALIFEGFDIANRRIIRARTADRLIIVGGFLAIVTGLFFASLSFFEYPSPALALADPITKLVKHPKVVAITSDLSVGHPLVRRIGGTWIGSEPNAFPTLGALYKLGLKPTEPPETARLVRVIVDDRARMAADIARGKPDIIIVERDELITQAWFADDQDLKAFLTGFHKSATHVGDFELWVSDISRTLE